MNISYKNKQIIINNTISIVYSDSLKIEDGIHYVLPIKYMPSMGENLENNLDKLYGDDKSFLLFNFPSDFPYKTHDKKSIIEIDDISIRYLYNPDTGNGSFSCVDENGETMLITFKEELKNPLIKNLSEKVKLLVICNDMVD